MKMYNSQSNQNPSKICYDLLFLTLIDIRAIVGNVDDPKTEELYIIGVHWTE